ncbi:MAG: hypothetical protein D6690_02220 [Nitrospirae bacterium]|nr:MAG: hypothetical protein D6690_02220 [Nitrospirota bacterium]
MRGLCFRLGTHQYPTIILFMPRLWVVSALVLAGWFIVLGSESSHAAEKAEVTVLVPDVLTSPGREVRLRARVVQQGLLGPVGVGGEHVEFIVQGQTVGTVMTGGDGWAYLAFAPRMRGNHTLTARVLESPRVKANEGTGLLASWERRKPILLVDLRATLRTRARPIPPLVPGMPSLVTLALGEPDPDAVAELEKLGKFYYNLMYIVPAESVTVLDLQQWLRQHQFPPGIPRIVEKGAEGLKAFLSQLKQEGWEHVGAGIGLTKDFAHALVSQRIRTIVLGDPDEREGYPRRTVIVENWKSVRKHL